MKCRICIKDIIKKKEDDKTKFDYYHDRCLVDLFGSLKVSPILDFSRKDFITEKARRRSRGMSISGVQPKLSMKIDNNILSITDTGGEYILKPTPEDYEELSINEFITMKLAEIVGIESPLFGLVEFSDGELAYIVKRFDREGSKKIQQEDMAQAMNVEKDNEGLYKYESESYESVGLFLKNEINLIVATNFFERVFFNFMIGNDDFHLKNISVIETSSNIGNFKLTPNYDSLNSVLYADGSRIGEMAMDLFSDNFDTKEFLRNGFISKTSFIELASRLGINDKVQKNIYGKYINKYDELIETVKDSELSDVFKKKFIEVMLERMKKFGRL